MNQETYEILLMKVVDGIATQEEEQQLDEHCRNNHDCQEELNSFLQIKASTDAMTARILKSAKIDPPRLSPGLRLVDSTGLLLILGAYTTLIGFAFYQLWTDPKMEPIVQYSCTALIIGFTVLFARVAVGRFTGGTDPYEEIDQ